MLSHSANSFNARSISEQFGTSNSPIPVSVPRGHIRNNYTVVNTCTRSPAAPPVDSKVIKSRRRPDAIAVFSAIIA